MKWRHVSIITPGQRNKEVVSMTENAIAVALDEISMTKDAIAVTLDGIAVTFDSIAVASPAYLDEGFTPSRWIVPYSRRLLLIGGFTEERNNLSLLFRLRVRRARAPLGASTLTVKHAYFRPFFAVSLALGAASGCAHSHQVRPLGKGNAAVHASVGGPMVGVFGAVLPIPILSVGGAYGVTDNVEVLGHVDATAALFGNFHYDFGAAWHPLISEQGPKPTLTLGGSAHVLATGKDVLVAPTFHFISAWRVARRHLIYVGIDSALPIREKATFIAGPLLGAEARVSKRLGFTLEAKYLAPWYDTTPNPPEWFSPGGHGFISALLGANVYFGEVK